MRFFNYILFAILSSFRCEAQQVVMQGHEREDYFTTILAQALSYFPDKKYQITFYNKDIPKVRVMQVIAQNAGIDIMTGGATQAREKALLPIRIPLLKGLQGWRIALVTSENKGIFKTHSNLSAFKTLVPGQYHSWSDTKVLESNGIVVEKGSDYNGLFDMLVSGRFDYFPRAIIEVEWEYQANKDKNIIIEPYSLIHYPTAYYFYVGQKNIALASDIEKGLELAIKDGSFDTLFTQYYGGIVQKVRSQNRQVFQLNNPHLSKETPLERTMLWLNLAN